MDAFRAQAPTTVSAIVGGDQPAHLTSNYLQRLDGLPLSWAEHESLLLR